MNDALSRVLLHWADSRIYWFPFVRLRPAREERMGGLPIVVHTFAGVFWVALWFALAGRLIWPGRWSWELPFVPGLVGGIAGFCWAMMVRMAWNRRVSTLAGAEAAPAPTGPASPALRPVERWLVQPAACLVVLALAVSLVVGIENLRGYFALRSLEAELRAAGAPSTLAEVVPPPIPDERNLAMSALFRPGLDYEWTDPASRQGLRWRDTNGWSHLHKLLEYEDAKRSFSSFQGDRRATGVPRELRSGWTDGLPVDLEAWRDYYASLPDWPKPSGPTTPGAAVLTALGRFDADLRELRAAATERAECRFPLAYEDGPAMLLPTLAPMKHMANALRLRACALLAENRTDEALADIRLASRLGDAIADEPILISLLVRFAIDQILLQPIWEGCRDHRWSDAQLVALQDLLSKRNHLGATRRALEGERLMSGVTYDMLARGDRRIMDLWDSNDSDGQDVVGTLIRCMPRGWIRQNQVVHYRYLHDLVGDLAAAKSHADLGVPGHRLEQYIKRNSLFTLIASMLAPATDNVSVKAFETEAWRRQALVGLALERYRLAEGRYPGALTALAPKYLPAVPDDPMDGKPLRYALQADGDYRLFSVGRDHGDNGGRRPEKRARNAADRGEPSDLVWR